MEQPSYFCFVHFMPFKNSTFVLWVCLLGFRGFGLVGGLVCLGVYVCFFKRTFPSAFKFNIILSFHSFLIYPSLRISSMKGLFRKAVKWKSSDGSSAVLLPNLCVTGLGFFRTWPQLQCL